MEYRLFAKLDELPVIVCTHCRYGVWPKEVRNHLKGEKHRLSTSIAKEVAQAVQGWDGLEWEPTRVQWPSHFPEAIPHLDKYNDGLLCLLNPINCRYIARSMDSMRRHWRDVHNFAVRNKAGRPLRSDQDPERLLAQAYKYVCCHRVFPNRHGSHYIEVLTEPAESGDDESTEGLPSPRNPNEVAEAVFQELEDSYRLHEEQREHRIEAGEKDEANPWLRRTQWPQYLEGLNVDNLLSSIEPPTAGDDPTGGNFDLAETKLQAIWAAMDRVVRISQAVTKQQGFIINMDAVRTEHHQNRYHPLQPYMNEDTISRHMRPWQQVLMFFARTQMAHDWESPGYRFTTRQRTTWEALWVRAEEDVPDAPDAKASEQADTNLTPLQEACLDFCLELLNQRIHTHEYDCALVCALAVLGRRHDGWRDPDDYPPILSKIIKIARFLVILKAYRLDPFVPEVAKPLNQRRGHLGGDLMLPSPMENPLYDFTGSQNVGFSGSQGSPALLPSSPNSTFSSPRPLGRNSESLRSSQGTLPGPGSMPRRPTFQEWVKLFMDTFMVKGTHGPMDWMLGLRTYGMRVHYSTTNPGHVAWNGNDVLLYRQYQFSMGDFRCFIHGLTTKARTVLREQLLLGGHAGAARIPQVPWNSLRDDPAEGKPEWSFLNDSRTRWPVNGSRWILGRLRAEPYLQRKWIRATGVQGTEASQYDINGKVALSYLKQLVQFREKMAVLVHICSGQPARGTELLSVRAVNTEVGGHRNLFIEDGMVCLITAYHKGYHLSGDIKTIHRYLPRELGELVIYYLWIVLPFARHLEFHLQRKGQFPNSRRNARQGYLWPPDPSGRHWDTDRLREALKRECRLGLKGQALSLQDYRHVAIAISRRFLRSTQAFIPNDLNERPSGAGEDPLGLEDDSMEDDVFDLQAGHSSHVAGMVYGRGVLDQPGELGDRRDRFRQTSVDWHRFLGFTSSYANGNPTEPLGHGLGLRQLVGKRKRAPYEIDAEESRLWRRWKLMEADLEAEFRQMMGRPDIQLREVQEPALRAIKTGESPVVAVMPTGGGKSLLFMLPAYIGSGGTTVVVVPLISLRADLQRRCEQLGISCVSWESPRPPHEASIVLVTPESALSDEFQDFLNRQRLLQRLDRLVVDECHLIIDEQFDFRPQLTKLGQLALAETQLIFLTATLPPRREPELWARLAVNPGQVWLYRSPTRRENIGYHVRAYRIENRLLQNPFRWPEDPRILAQLRELVRRTVQGKVIVYAPTRSIVQWVAEELGCEAYFSDKHLKELVLQRFIRGPERVIVATSALGLGIDIPDIRTVIHLGKPRSLSDYAQESGRNEFSKAIDEAWKKMLGFWMNVVNAEDIIDKNVAWRQFRNEYSEFPRVVEYIEREWLQHVTARRFLHCYTNENLHFGNTATSRIESAHWMLKQELHISTNDLLSCLRAFERAVEHQHSVIQGKINDDRIRKPISLLRVRPLFRDVLNRVSSYALWRTNDLRNAYYPIGAQGKKDIPLECTGKTRKTLGLPCIHVIQSHVDAGTSLTMQEYHPHWHIAPETDPTAIDPRLLLREPEIGQVRGRPAGSRNRNPTTSTTRESSQFEIVEQQTNRRGQRGQRGRQRGRQLGSQQGSQREAQVEDRREVRQEGPRGGRRSGPRGGRYGRWSGDIMRF